MVAHKAPFLTFAAIACWVQTSGVANSQLCDLIAWLWSCIVGSGLSCVRQLPVNAICTLQASATLCGLFWCGPTTCPSPRTAVCFHQSIAPWNFAVTWRELLHYVLPLLIILSVQVTESLFIIFALLTFLLYLAQGTANSWWWWWMSRVVVFYWCVVYFLFFLCMLCGVFLDFCPACLSTLGVEPGKLCPSFFVDVWE